MRGFRVVVEVINVISIILRSCSRAARRMWGRAVLRVTWYVARTCISRLLFIDWFWLLALSSTAWAILLRVVRLHVILADWQEFRRKRGGSWRDWEQSPLTSRYGHSWADWNPISVTQKRIHNHSIVIIINETKSRSSNCLDLNTKVFSFLSNHILCNMSSKIVKQKF